MTTRRKFIASVGTIGTVAIAGCSGASLTGGPEEAVEQYVAASKEGNVEKAREVVYTGGRSFRESDLSFSGELVSTSEISSAELAESGMLGAESEEEVVRIKNDIKSETGADEVAFVMVEINRDDRTSESPVPVIKIEGDWMVVLM